MFGSEIVIAVISWAAGIFGAVIVQQVLNRRGVLGYFVQHQYLGSSAQDKTFGNVEITWNGSPVANLYLSTIELINESSQDLENITVRAYTGDTRLLSEFPQLVGTTQFIKYSPDYEAFLKIPEGERASQSQVDTYGQRREYVIPVMNRGQIARFQYLNTPSSPGQPTIWLESIHPGVSLKFRVPRPLVHGVPQRWAALAGIVVGLVAATLFAAYSPLIWVTALGCLAVGLVAQVPGAYVVRAVRAVRQWVVG